MNVLNYNPVNFSNQERQILYALLSIDIQERAGTLTHVTHLPPNKERERERRRRLHSIVIIIT